MALPERPNTNDNPMERLERIIARNKQERTPKVVPKVVPDKKGEKSSILFEGGAGAKRSAIRKWMRKDEHYGSGVRKKDRLALEKKSFGHRQSVASLKDLKRAQKEAAKRVSRAKTGAERDKYRKEARLLSKLGKK